MSEEVIVHYLSLECTDLSPAPAKPRGVEITESELKVGTINQFFYRWVGAEWAWFDKRDWSLSSWQAYAESVSLYIISLEGTPVGYFELGESDCPNAIELCYFGLAEPGLNRGLGSYCLWAALNIAFKTKPRVTVNTCTLDHPSALPNYLKRGFKELRREIEHR